MTSVCVTVISFVAEKSRGLGRGPVSCMRTVEASPPASPRCLLYFGYERSAGGLVFQSCLASPSSSFDPLCSSPRRLDKVLMASLGTHSELSGAS